MESITILVEQEAAFNQPLPQGIQFRPVLARCGCSRQCSEMPAMEGKAEGRQMRPQPPLVTHSGRQAIQSTLVEKGYRGHNILADPSMGSHTRCPPKYVDVGWQAECATWRRFAEPAWP